MREISKAELEQVSGGISPMHVPGGLQGSGLVNFANSRPEYPNAKPGSKLAVFDLWEDALEIRLGPASIDGGYQGSTYDSYIKTI